MVSTKRSAPLAQTLDSLDAYMMHSLVHFTNLTALSCQPSVGQRCASSTGSNGSGSTSSQCDNLVTKKIPVSPCVSSASLPLTTHTASKFTVSNGSTVLVVVDTGTVVAVGGVVAQAVRID